MLTPGPISTTFTLVVRHRWSEDVNTREGLGSRLIRWLVSGGEKELLEVSNGFDAVDAPSLSFVSPGVWASLSVAASLFTVREDLDRLPGNSAIAALNKFFAIDLDPFFIDPSLVALPSAYLHLSEVGL